MFMKVFISMNTALQQRRWDISEPIDCMDFRNTSVSSSPNDVAPQRHFSIENVLVYYS